MKYIVIILLLLVISCGQGKQKKLNNHTIHGRGKHFIVDIAKPYPISYFVIVEGNKGNIIEYQIQVYEDRLWRDVIKGSKINGKIIHPAHGIIAKKIRLRITRASTLPYIDEFSCH